MLGEEEMVPHSFFFSPETSSNFILFAYVFSAMLGIEPGASCLLVKGAITDCIPFPSFIPELVKKH